MSEFTVFLSHTAQDKKWVHEFAKALRQRDIAVWLDEWKLKSGEPWQEALENGLRSSEAIVSVMDVDSERDWTWALYEIGLAVGMGKRIVFVLPKDAPLDKLPVSIRETAVLRRGTPEDVAQEVALLKKEHQA